MTDIDRIQKIHKRCGVDHHWIFKQGYLYMEVPESDWYITVQVKEYFETGHVPTPVAMFAERLLTDYAEWFTGNP